MRSMAVSLCICALAACASGKSAEPPIENPNEPSLEERAERVRETGDYTIESESERESRSERDGDRDGRAERKRAGAGEDADRGADRDRDRERDRERDADKEPAAADNTGINERDEAPGALMPTDQGESDSDLEITQKIRKAVMDDDSLSFAAKNVKIITQDGKVTLRGPVKSTHERNAIGAAAKKFAAGSVDNQLEVAN